MAEQYGAKFTVDISQPVAAFKILQNAFTELNAQMANVGQGAGLLGVEKMRQGYETFANEGIAGFKALRAELAAVEKAQQRVAKTGGTVQLTKAGYGDLGARVAANRGVANRGRTTADAGQLAGTKAQIEALMAKLISSFQTINAEVAQYILTQTDPRVLSQANELLTLAQQRLNVEQRAKELLSGAGTAQAIQARRDALFQRLSELEGQRAQMEAHLQSTMPQRQSRDVDSMYKARDKEAQALRQQEASMQRITALTNELAGKAGKAQAGVFATPKNLQEVQLLAQALERIQGTSAGSTKAVEQLRRELERYAEATRTVARAQEQQKPGASHLASFGRSTGVGASLGEVQKSIAQVTAEIDKTFGEGAARRLFPTLDADLVALKQIELSLASGKLTTQQENKALAEQARLVERIGQTLNRGATAAMPQARSPQQMQQAMMAQMPLMERTFTQVFSDMQRRFIATFQFAISGALIFGTQRLIREFVQTAIEVERAFADIESALEFDIEANRGTVEFALQVETVRRQVLLLADEFNTLPTEANKSAFVMVSRFKEMDNAMLALRAQLLAVKVSTIDQSEVLRALTAVAEGFASAIFDVNDGLTLQEKLLNREAAAATLYGKALDLAVYIQQKFGVEVEDTLEGTARSTEVFKQMGFTMEQTAAIVAATSRELGQTGQQTAERLNRSLGQLTDPKIRNALLDLAAGSEEFSLSFKDFESGATAWERINEQFTRLEKTSPGVARSILQIVGQRRELEAVAAALGTSQLQAEIVAGSNTAAGAAEKRFSFLKRTVSEVLESIKGQFQELSQNFERLGGLTSIKLLVGAFDALLTQLNKVLKFLIDIVGWVDRMPGLGGLGSMAIQALALAGALLTAVRVAEALAAAFRNLATAKAGGVVADSLSAGIGAYKAAAVAGGVQGAALLGPKIGGFVASAAAAGKAIGAFATSAIAAIPVWGQIAAAGLLVAYMFKGLHDRSQALAESYKVGNAAIQDAASDAAAESRRLSENVSEAILRLNQAQLDAATAREGVAPSGQPGALDFSAALIKDLVVGVASPFIGDRQFELQGLIEATVDPAIVKGSKEYFQDLIEGYNKAILAEMANSLSGEARKLDRLDLGGLTDTFVGGLFESLNIGLSDLVIGKIKQANDALSEGDVEGAYALLAEADAMRLRILELFGIIDQELTESASALNDELGHLDTRVALGEITKTEAAVRAAQIADLLKGIYADAKEAQDLGGQVTDEELAQLQADAENAFLDSIKKRSDALQDEVDSIRTGTLGKEESLRQELEIIRSHPDIIKGDDEEAKKWRRRILDIEDELIKLSLTRAIAEANHAVAMARTADEKIAATKLLIDVLRRQAAIQKDILDNADEAASVERQAEAQELANARAAADEAKKSAVARQRMAGPILNSMNQIKAQIVGVKSDIASGFLSAAEVMEAQVQLNELIAQLAQAEFDRVAALAKSKVSVRDAMRQNQLALTLLNRELELAVKIFGYQSAEWSNIKTNIEAMKAALMDQALELESIQRKLGGDITDGYIQSQLALIDALQKQKVPGQGELEQARSDLAAKEAHMNDIREFYNDRLFTLSFDFARGDISKSQYIANLKLLLADVDLTSKQGKEIWMEINSLIEGMTDDVGDMQFNIPGEIRLPTLFEVRRSLAADALGVNYQDNRQQDIRIYVDSDVDVARVADAVNEGLGSQAATASARFAPGSSTLTLGI